MKNTQNRLCLNKDEFLQNKLPQFSEFSKQGNYLSQLKPT